MFLLLWMIMHQQAIRSTVRAIIADRDPATAELIAELLTSERIVPLRCSVGGLSLAFIEQAQAHLLILELGSGDPSPTLALLDELRGNAPTRELPVIVNSTDDRLLERLAALLHDLGCVVLAKPFELDDFFSSISLCLGNIVTSACNGSPVE
jgi:DNA-binding response OmpR family regulator